MTDAPEQVEQQNTSEQTATNEPVSPPDAETTSSVQGRFSETMKSLKENALRLIWRRRNTHEQSGENDEEIRIRLQTAVRDGMQHRDDLGLDTVFAHDRQPPQNIDVLEVVNNLTQQARQDPSVLEVSGVLQDFIMQLQHLENDDMVGEEGQQEAAEYKRRLIDHYTDLTVNQEARRQNTDLQGRQQLEAVAQEWKRGVGSDYPPEALSQQVAARRRRAPEPTQPDIRILSTEQLFNSIPNPKTIIDDYNARHPEGPITNKEVDKILRGIDAFYQTRDEEGLAHANVQYRRALGEAEMPGDIKKQLLNNLLAWDRAVKQRGQRQEREKDRRKENPYVQEQREIFDEMAGESRQNAERVLAERAERNSATANDAVSQFANECFAASDNPKDLQEKMEQLKQLRKSINANRRISEGGPELNQRELSEFNSIFRYLGDYLDRRQNRLTVNEGRLQNRTDQLTSTIFRDNPSDLEFINQRLNSPDIALEEARHDIVGFSNRIIHIYNQVLARADLRPEEFFERALDQMYEAPVLNEIARSVRNVQQLAVAKERDIRLGVGGEQLSEELKKLLKKLETERHIRSFTHNIAVLTAQRGKLEQIAGYAEQMQSADLGAMFQDEPLVLEAAQLFEQKITQALSSNNWRNDQKFMQSVLEHGGPGIDAEVIAMMRRQYKQNLQDGTLQDWQIERAYRLAKGTHIGATAVVFDLFAEADPPVPSAGDQAAYTGYYGERILSTWNPMRHFFVRWEQPNEITDLMYAIMAKEGTMRGWDHRMLKQVESRLNSARGSNRLEIIAELQEQYGGKPFIEMVNLFKVGGVIARGGWRTDRATYHLLEEVDDQTRSQDSRYESIPHVYMAGGAKKDLRGVDWEKSWENFRRAGTEVMHYWMGQRAENEVMVMYGIDSPAKFTSAHHDEVDKLKKKYMGDMLNHIRRVNPLWFAFREKEEMYDPELFQRSIRGRALIALCQRFPEAAFVRTMGDIEKLPDHVKTKILQTEDNLMLVHKKALKGAWDTFDAKGQDAWNTRRGDSRFLVDGNEEAYDFLNDEEKDLAKVYFASLKDSLTDQKVEKYNREFPYSIGSEDLDLSKFKYSEAGASMVGRTWGDANDLSAGANKLFELRDILTAANAEGYGGNKEKALHGLADFIKEVTAPLENVHGHIDKYNLSEQLFITMDRYFKKSWFWRLLPEPIEGLVERLPFVKVSRSREAHGLRSWNWTENESWELLEIMQAKDLLDDEHKQRLRRIVGARVSQVYLVDVFRSSGMLIAFLLLYQAIEDAMKDEQ